MDARFANPGEKPHPQLILVILPANAADCRRAVKHWGDIKMRVSTQCVVRLSRSMCRALPFTLRFFTA